jgi:DeoR/GlpR family transcriptional regulator of sugar metabolism
MKDRQSSGNLIAAERRSRIYKCALENGSVNVTDLAKLFDVAENTIRNDLRALHVQGRLIRSYGGAIVKEKVRPAEPYSITRVANMLQKSAIGEKAAKYLPDSGFVFINAGSTTRQLVSHIPEGWQAHVTTNSPEIAIYLSSEKGVEVDLLGGRMERESCETDGSLSEAALADQYWDVAFIGISAIDTAHGITSISRRVSGMEGKVLAHSRKVIGLCDSSKFSRYSHSRSAAADVLDVLVTDSGISDQLRNEFADLGVTLDVADVE